MRVVGEFVLSAVLIAYVLFRTIVWISAASGVEVFADNDAAPSDYSK
jgi:hypothetical protein